MQKKFEWLTEEICKEYIERAKALPPDTGLDIGPWRELRIELQNRCNVTEIEAFNILRGYHVKDYLQIYGFLSGRIPMTEAFRKMLEKSEKEKKKTLKEKVKEYEARIEALENNSFNGSTPESGYSFEEID